MAPPATATRTASGSNGSGHHDQHGPLPHQLPNAPRYDLARAIRSAASGKGRRGSPGGLEGEVSQEIARRRGDPPSGFLVPLDAPCPRMFRRGVERRDLLAGSTGSGAVQTNQRVDLLIDLLRARSVVSTLGATIIGAGPGNLSIPKRTATPAVYWVSEPNAPTEGAPTVGSVDLEPRTLSGSVDLTRGLISRQSASVDLVIGDLMAGIASEVDRVALAGSGIGTEPEGIVGRSDIPTIALGTDGAAPTWAKLLDLELAVGSAGGDMGALGFVTTPNGRHRLRRLEKAAGSGIVWDRGQVLDVPALATAHLPSTLSKGATSGSLSAAVYGDWSSLIVALWGDDTIEGAIDVLVDPFALGTAGGIRITALLDLDVDVRHVASFARILDMATT